MPEITIYTNDGDCANGVAEINPFTAGDATDEWTLKFNNGTDFYSPSNVTMRVGHVNGLPDGTYSNAFKWVDRADNESIATIGVASGVPTLSFDTDPLGGVVGTNGVYILRGPELDGSIASASIEYPGRYLPYWTTQSVLVAVPNVGDGTDGVVQLNINSSYQVQNYIFQGVNTSNVWLKGYVDSVSVVEAGSKFTGNQSVSQPLVADSYGIIAGLSRKFIQVIHFIFQGINKSEAVFEDGQSAIISVKVNAPQYEFPFKRDESGNDIIAATTLSPYSDGEVTGTTQYEHSTLVIRPETVATASLISSGLNWVGTMNPINAYTTSRLSLRNSTQLDLQIRGDGRTLFQGQLTILNKIA
jgi:hypothetical protein